MTEFDPDQVLYMISVVSLLPITIIYATTNLSLLNKTVTEVKITSSYRDKAFMFTGTRVQIGESTVQQENVMSSRA